MEPLVFDLIGADGRAHTYEVLPHNTEEGLPIVGKLMQAGIPALAALVGGAAGQGGAGLMAQLAALRSGATPAAEGIATLIGGMDLPGLGDKLAAAIPQLDIARLGPELMRRTTRDGAQLANPAEFNKAFKANYWELIAACQKVIAHNRFLPRLGS
jgi:hypothetical protein